jgi:hypothetical protein
LKLLGNAFLNTTPIAQIRRVTIEKWVCIKLKSSCIAKEITTTMKRKPIEWGKKIFASYSLDKGLIFRIFKELKKLSSKRTNNLINNKWTN